MPSADPDALSQVFAAESVLAARLEVYAAKSRREGREGEAAFYRALAASHQVRAGRYLMLMRGKVGEPEDNRTLLLESEVPALAALYRDLGTKALEAGQRPAASALAQAAAVAAEYPGLAERAGGGPYYVCGVCGYVAEGGAPENCPVCGAIPDKFTVAP